MDPRAGVLLVLLAALSAANNNNNQDGQLLHLSTNNNIHQSDLLHLQGNNKRDHFPDTSSSSNNNNTDVTAVDGRSPGRVLARRRRYIVFRTGSSIQLVYCMSVRAYIPFATTSTFVFGATAGLAWQLPTEPEQLYLQRRSADPDRHPDTLHRAKLYRSLQTFLSQRGLPGEECVQRTVCESTGPRGGTAGKAGKGTFMEEVLSVLFNFPEESAALWGAARYNGTPCAARFPRCNSLLDITLPVVAAKK